MPESFALFEAPFKGISLVEAGAGTGKTYNIASLYVRAILELKLKPASILVLTYTEAATTELKARLRNRIQESIRALERGNEGEDGFLKELTDRYDPSKSTLLKQALYSFDEARISTIHGFCQRLLKENSLEFGVRSDFEIITDESQLLQDVIDNFWRGFFQNPETEFEEVLQSYLIDKKISPDSLRIDISMVLRKKYAVIEPQYLSLDEYSKLYKQLSDRFFQLQKVFNTEREELISILDSDVLNGNKYRNRERHFEEISSWLDQDYPPLYTPEKLFTYGSYMREEGTRKGKTVPELLLHQTVDAYLDSARNFENLEQAFKQHSIEEVRRELKLAKKKRNILSYDDLLITVDEGLKSGSTGLIRSIRKQLPLALVDEFQDTDPIQYSIFKSIYSANSDTVFFMIGDPKQAIYNFRGADIYTYLRAKEGAGRGQVYALRYNYRSNPEMIQAVNELFSASDNPFGMRGLNFIPARFPANKDESEGFLWRNSTRVNALQLLEVPELQRNKQKLRELVADSVASEIVELLSGEYFLDNKRVRQNDIAVLVRTNQQARLIQDMLRQRRIQSLIKGRESVFKTKEAEEFYYVLTAIQNPSLEDGIRAALTTQLLAYNAEDIVSLMSRESEWEQVYLQFTELNRIWSDNSFAEMSEMLFNNFHIEQTLATFFDAERRITNLYHILELLKKAEAEHRFQPKILLRYFKSKLFDESSAPEDEIIRLESDQKLVQIVTMHASKGLEYPIVFCPYIYEGLNTDDRGRTKVLSFHKDQKACIDIGSGGESRIENRIASKIEELEESLRLTYVALTRAESACFVYLSSEAAAEFSPLASLLEGYEVVKERIEAKIKKKPHPIQPSDLSDAGSKLASHRCIELREAVLNKDIFTAEEPVEEEKLMAKTFSREDLKYAVISSFSSMSESRLTVSGGGEKSGFDYDATEDTQVNSQVYKPTIFSLPKGTKTGTLLHSVFEEITFDDPQSYRTVIENQLEKFSFDKRWLPVVEQITKRTMNQLLLSHIRLGELSAKDLLVEMEFHFPFKHISTRGLYNLIRGERAFSDPIDISGFMKGFIDLCFHKDGKYYILDYKSNYLGQSPEDYNSERLQYEITHSSYDLQYHIYTLALHRMLSQNVYNYAYESHFGGVFYLFLRGIDPEIKNSGVFFSRPGEEVIYRLDSFFRGERENDS